MTTTRTDPAPAAEAATGETIANTIRFLSADGVQKAKSGHPGMPMGCSDIATVLLTRVLRIDPNDPTWFNRDRFVLSAGHGSMLLYSMLHLMGYLELDDLRQFRQHGSRTPGHPEVGHVPGCDVTGGPLGAGFTMGVGLTLAERMLAERYNRPGHEVVDHYTYVLMSDGCHMEGITNEAASLAGHLKLAKLIALYDDNEISIEGSTDLAFTENVNARYEALGWHVQDIDGHDHSAIAQAIACAQQETNRPSLIVCHTTIGKGAPNKAGTAASHGEPLGEEELLAAKKALGWPEKSFYVPQEVYEYFRRRKTELADLRQQWDARFAALQQTDGAAADVLKRILAGQLPEGWEDATPAYAPDAKGLATRASGGEVLNAFAEKIDELVGGSADLAPSNKTVIKQGCWTDFIEPGCCAGRNIHFGVREHAMGNIVNGLALHGLVPFGATFLVFHDYMRPALRLAALQELRSIFVYTHDSFYVGEDGPTHQPVEHLAAMRAIPRLHVMRPCDANEVAQAWRHAIGRAGAPTAICLTRQNLPTLDREKLGPAEGTLLGGYILSDDAGAELLFVATGSEVHLAMAVADQLRKQGRKVRIVSMPCLDLFLEQPPEYQDGIVSPAIPKRVVLEAGIEQGWGRILGCDGLFVGMDDFGASGPCAVLAEAFGFTPEAVLARIQKAGW